MRRAILYWAAGYPALANFRTCVFSCSVSTMESISVRFLFREAMSISRILPFSGLFSESLTSESSIAQMNLKWGLTVFPLSSVVTWEETTFSG